MTDIATFARNSALQLEVKKDGLAQRQDGRWQLKVIIHPNDMPAALSLAPMGTRYMAALVEIGDDEQPVNRKGGDASAKQQPAHTKQPRQPSSSADGAERRSWGDLPPAQQAGIRCAEPAFWRFLNETSSEADVIDNADKAATYVRLICGIESRAELTGDHRARLIWRDLDSKYRAWMEAG